MMKNHNALMSESHFKNIMRCILSEKKAIPNDQIADVVDDMLRENPNPTPNEMWAMLLRVANDERIVDEKSDSVPWTMPFPNDNRVRRLAAKLEAFIREHGEIRESVIRETYGNSPDTSKALRLLQKSAMITRTGLGGRVSPFTYKCKDDDGL